MSAGTTQFNLDRLAARHAQEIIRSTKDKKASDVDNTVTKALGVLKANGVYACFLYLLAKEKENGAPIIEEMLNLLAALPFGWSRPDSMAPEKILERIGETVTADLERLLLAKETLEQMLIYARYGAKARSEKKNSGGEKRESS
jgi:hypothetical protein